MVVHVRLKATLNPEQSLSDPQLGLELEASFGCPAPQVKYEPTVERLQNRPDSRGIPHNFTRIIGAAATVVDTSVPEGTDGPGPCARQFMTGYSLRDVVLMSSLQCSAPRTSRILFHSQMALPGENL